MSGARLGADRTRAAFIEAQILRLERSLSALRIEKAQIQERLDSYKYPVLTLPNEIVSEIFLQFVSDYPTCPPLTGVLSPTSLTQICREWREIALATPALWRAIPLSDHSIPFKRRAHIVDMWLSRSRHYPLSLQFDANLDWMYESEVIASVVPHRARWEHLELDISSSYLASIEGPMPLLQHLELILEEDYMNPPVGVAFCDVPLLRTVILNDFAAANVNLPWAQLTSLVLDRVYPHECIPLLQQTSNLIHCELRLYYDDTIQIPDIGLPRLESLVLKDSGPVAVEGYINTFLVSALHSLEIPERFLGPNPIDSLTSFITKSGCKLQEVRITGQRSVTEDSYYETFSSIQKFSFDGSYMDDEDDSSASNSSDEGNSE